MRNFKICKKCGKKYPFELKECPMCSSKEVAYAQFYTGEETPKGDT